MKSLPLKNHAARGFLLMLSKRTRYDDITLEREQARTAKERLLSDLEPVAGE